MDQQIGAKTTDNAAEQRDSGKSPLASTGDFLQRLYAFLNTPLGLWVLSSIALALIAHSYATVVSHLDSQRQKKESIDWIDLEIKHHIDTLRRFLGTTGPLPVARVPSVAYMQMIAGSLNGLTQNYVPLFPIAINRSVHSLMLQLATYVDDKDDKANIVQAANAMLLLSEYVISLRDHSTPVELDPRSFGQYRQPLNEQELEKWNAEIKKNLESIMEFTEYKNMNVQRWYPSLKSMSEKKNEIQRNPNKYFRYN